MIYEHLVISFILSQRYFALNRLHNVNCNKCCYYFLINISFALRPKYILQDLPIRDCKWDNDTSDDLTKKWK